MTINDVPAFITGIGVALVGLAAAISKVSASIAELKGTIEVLKEGHATNAANIHAVALATPAPSQAVTLPGNPPIT
jgi:hypothetical protein